jgi:hypothetical protein
MLRCLEEILMSDHETDILIWSERQGELLRRRAAGEGASDGGLRVSSMIADNI